MIIPIVVASSHRWLGFTHVSSRKQTWKRIGMIKLPVINWALLLALPLRRPFADPIVWRGLICCEIHRLCMG